MFVFLLTSILILLLADRAGAWGLTTHMELTQAVLGDLVGIGSGMAGLILAYKRDFIYGNIIADIIVGKKLSKRRRRSHHWGAGRRLLETAKDNQRRVFAYGFLTHLAADTVAHNRYIPKIIETTGSTLTFGHLYWELRADQLAQPDHKRVTKQLLKLKHLGHQHSLARRIYPPVKWFGFNRTVFTRLNRLTNGNGFSVALDMCEDLSRWQLSPQIVGEFKDQARERMLDLICDGPDSAVTGEDPNGYLALQTVKARRRIVLPMTGSFPKS